MNRGVMRYGVPGIIGLALASLLWAALAVWMPYQRERAIAREIESVGGKVLFGYCGPQSLPHSIQTRLVCCHRIWCASFRSSNNDSTFTLSNQKKVSPALFRELNSLAYLRDLDLGHTNVSDADLEHLAGMNLYRLNLDDTEISDEGLKYLNRMPSLTELSFCQTEITDTGLKYLESMSSLKRLMLYNTNPTAEGLANLRKALPNCYFVSFEGTFDPEQQQHPTRLGKRRSSKAASQ